MSGLPIIQYAEFKEGYGKFPYILIKPKHGVYLQIPVHFIKQGEKEDLSKQPGTHVYGLTPAMAELSTVDVIDQAHEILIERVLWMKKKVESENDWPFQYILVEGPEKAWYLQSDGDFSFSEKIPEGGRLLTQGNELLAMHNKHYLDDEEENGFSLSFPDGEMNKIQ